MARRQSPLLVRQHTAHLRERKVEQRAPRDDGFLRRSEREAATAQEVREASAARKLTPSQERAAEISRRIALFKAKGNDAVDMRAALMPLNRAERRAVGHRGPAHVWRPDVAKRKKYKGKVVARTLRY